MDTAGFHEKSDNEIEQMGIERTIKCAKEADVIIAVFDYSQKFAEDDNAIVKFLESVEDKKIIYVINKTDLEKNIDYNFESGNSILLSTKNKMGKKELIEQIKYNVAEDDIDLIKKETYINIVEKNYLRNAIEEIERCLIKIENEESLDIIAEEARTITKLINNISHPTTADDVIGEIFSKFCIGK